MTRRPAHAVLKRFTNLENDRNPTFSELRRMFRSKWTAWPRHIAVTTRKPPRPQLGSELVVTFIGHSTFLLQSSQSNVLTDPVYSTYAGPFGRVGPKRVRLPAVSFSDLPEISTVLLSHNHYDHCDLVAIRKLSRTFDPLFVTPTGNKRLLKGAGARRVEELGWWETTSSPGYDITVTPARHFSARTPFDRNKALWGGFTFGMCENKLRVFFAGDTGYGMHFTQIASRLGSPHLSLLPIGAYEPRWFMKPIHMNPEEAVRAHLELGSNQSIACHFGTFQLTAEGIDEPALALQRSLADNGIPEAQFRVVPHGESVRISAS